MTLPNKLQKTIEEFKTLETNTEKYEELLNYGEELEEMPSEFKVKENLVPGCTSVVYIKAILQNGKVHLYGSSDSYLVKGLVAVLVEGLNGEEVQTIIDLKPDFLIDFGLSETLSATRANASINIFNMIKEQAMMASNNQEAASK